MPSLHSAAPNGPLREPRPMRPLLAGSRQAHFPTASTDATPQCQGSPSYHEGQVRKKALTLSRKILDTH